MEAGTNLRNCRGSSQWWQRRPVLLIVALLAAVPFLYPAIPPLIDLPTHIARYRVELDLASSSELQKYFTFNWRIIPNLGADLLVIPLAPIFGLEGPVKLIVTITAVTTAGAFLWIAWEGHHKIPPTAFLALPLVFSYPLIFRFLNYALSMSLALLAFGLWLHLSKRNMLYRRTWLFLLIAPIVWITHLMGWGVLGVLCFTAEATRLRHQDVKWLPAVNRATLACLPMALPLILELAFSSNRSGIEFYYGSAFLATKAKWIIGIGRDRWLVPDLLFGALLYGFILMALARPRQWQKNGTLLSGAIALGILFLIFPFTLAGSAFADVRLLPYAIALAILSFAPTQATPAVVRARWAWGTLSVFLAKVVIITASTATYANTYRTHLTALDHIAHGSAIAMMVGRDCTTWSKKWMHPRLDGLANIATVRKDSVTNFQFVASNAQLLGIKPGYRQGDPGVPAPIISIGECSTDAPSLEENISRMNPAKFDYLWLINVSPALWPQRPWLTPLWQGGNAVLYSINRSTSLDTKQ